MSVITHLCNLHIYQVKPKYHLRLAVVLKHNFFRLNDNKLLKTSVFYFHELYDIIILHLVLICCMNMINKIFFFTLLISYFI